MKTKNTIGVALLTALVASFAYWLGYQHGASTSRIILNSRSNLQQVGLAFRAYHNDIGRFSITGSVASPNQQAQQP